MTLECQIQASPSEVYQAVKRGSTFILCHPCGASSVAETAEHAWHLCRGMAHYPTIGEYFIVSGIYFQLV